MPSSCEGHLLRAPYLQTCCKCILYSFLLVNCPSYLLSVSLLVHASIGLRVEALAPGDLIKVS